MKIIDCFMFFNELDLLEFRLKLLDKHVDHFVIAESNITHSGKPKPYHFEENKKRFEPWLQKIMYIPLQQSPDGLDFNKEENNYNPTSAAFTIENGHRNGLMSARSLVADEDLVLISDLDEIPDPFILKKLDVSTEALVLSQRFHYYFFNCRNAGTEKWWHGTNACSGKQFKVSMPQEFRDNRNIYKSIPKAGWHFSFLGGVEKIKYKISSFAHTEFNKEKYLDDERIRKAISEGIDIFDRPGAVYEFVSIDAYPSFVRNIMLQYPSFIYPTMENIFSRLYYRFKSIFS